MNVYFVTYEDGGWDRMYDHQGEAYYVPSKKNAYITCSAKKRVVELVKIQFPQAKKFKIKLLGSAQ